MLTPDRTEFDDGYQRIFHVCSTSAANYQDLCSKYGADNVKKSASGKGITDALAMCMSGRGDKIRIWPGTYTTTETITINKTGVTIEGALKDNPYAAIIDSTTSGVVAFTFGATGDYSTIKNLTILMDVTGPSDAIIVPVNCPGVTLDSVVIPNGANTASTVGIDAESDYLTVKNCKIFGVVASIQSLGNYCTFERNHIVNNIASAVGIDMQDGDYHMVRGNVLDILNATTTHCTKIGTSAKCNQVSFVENRYNKGADVFITNGNSSTLEQWGDITGDVTTAAWSSTT